MTTNNGPSTPPPLPPEAETQYNYGRRPSPPPPAQGGGGTGWGFNALTSCLVAGCVTVLVPVLLVGGFFLLVYAALSSGIDEARTGTFGSFMPSVSPTSLNERLIRAGDADAGTIAIVNIHGVIDGNGSTLDGTGNMGFISQQLRTAGDNDAVKAVILQIDTPGGGLTASDQLYNEVQLLRRKGKPVLAWAGGMMMSGGYYIAVAADRIMANPTATVGSIGVIMQHFQVEDLLAKIGVKVDPVASGEHKDIGSPFREMTAEERALLQRYVGSSHARFVDIVAKGREMPVEKVRQVANGDIFNADTALELGLVDAIGYIQEAVAWAEKAAGEENMRIVSYRRLLSLGDFFTETGSAAAKAAAESVADAVRAGNSRPDARAGL